MAGTADVVATALTGNAWIDAILGGAQWSSGAGPATLGVYVGGLAGAESLSDGWGGRVLALAPTEAERAGLDAALAAYAEVCDLALVPVATPNDADLLLAVTNDADAYGALGWANPPGGGHAYGDDQGLAAWNRDQRQATDPALALAPGGYDFLALLQLLGTALGLGAPHDDGSGTPTLPGVASPYDLGDGDANQGLHTVMSWNDGWPAGPLGPSPSPDWGWQIGPMAFDIAGLQALYGANATTRAGADTYALPDANAPGTGWRCLWDAGGTDRIQGAALLANVIDLRAATLADGPGTGGFASWADGVWGGVTIAAGAVIENATGGALADRLTGNAAANHLKGLAGDDHLLGLDGDDALEGGEGDDRMEGGTGNDTYWVDSLLDRVLENAGEGTDQIRATLTLTLPDHVENLRLVGPGPQDGTGNALPNWILGNAAANVLLGLAGNDTLEGQGGDDWLDGGPGGDRLRGGTGDDTFVVDNTGDSVVEAPDAGHDTVRASVSLALATDVEDLVLLGAFNLSGRGNAGHNRLEGNGGANLLEGLDGDDRLLGMGGADRIEGGRGLDALDGGDGADRLQGDGGVDDLWGGAGDDAFVYRATTGMGDRIHDWGLGADRIEVAAAVFGLDPGALDPARFQARDDAAPQDADDRFVFRRADATLWFDADGTGPTAALLVASLQPGATLGAGDILVVA